MFPFLQQILKFKTCELTREVFFLFLSAFHNRVGLIFLRYIIEHLLWTKFVQLCLRQAKQKNQDLFIIVHYKTRSLHCNFIPHHPFKCQLCSLLVFTCSLISTLQSCTPAAALFSPHCTLPIMFPQHTLRRNNFVTTSLHLLPLQRIQSKVTCLKWCYSWGTRTINFLFKNIKPFHIKISHIQYQFCNC